MAGGGGGASYCSQGFPLCDVDLLISAVQLDLLISAVQCCSFIVAGITCGVEVENKTDL